MTSRADDQAKTVLAKVTGRVQGVSFRAWTRNEARQLGLGGWVRNECDGSVTVLLSGPESAILRMVSRLRQGPTGASVTGITFTETASEQPPPDFTIVV